MMNKNKLFRQIHIYLSLFFLPCAFIFALTGIMCILGVDKDIGMKIEKYQLVKNIQEGGEKEALLEYLKENDLKIPSNTEKIKNKGRGLTIGGIHYSASIIQIAPNEYNIILKTRSFLGDMIMLHKDKGTWYFSVLSIGFGIALFILYISGLMITLFVSKKDRNKQFIALGIGVVVTLFLAYLSL